MAIDIQTVRDGKIARTFHLENWLSALRQLRASNGEQTWFCTSRTDPTNQAQRGASPSPSIRMRIEAMTDIQAGRFRQPLFHNRIDRCDPATGATAPFAELPAPPVGLAFDADGSPGQQVGPFARTLAMYENRPRWFGLALDRSCSGCVRCRCILVQLPS